MVKTYPRSSGQGNFLTLCYCVFPAPEKHLYVAGCSMSAARFSVIITCHNQFHLIAEAVNSASTRSFADKEVIVVDDASADGSDELLGAFSDQIGLVRLDKNVGMT